MHIHWKQHRNGTAKLNTQVYLKITYSHVHIFSYVTCKRYVKSLTFIAPHVESLRRQNEHTICPTFQTKFHSFLTVEALDLTQKQGSQ